MDTKKYLQYNHWANQKIGQRLLPLGDTVLDTQIPGSFDSLRKSFYHLLDAEYIWLSRLYGSPQGKNISLEMANMNETVNKIDETSKQLITFFENTPQINSIIPIKTIDGNIYYDMIDEILIHISNHACYHRGQLINMLRAMGEDKDLPKTDFIYYCRLVKAGNI
jgi:uncharacterized damage-inducible protein DinB